MTVSLFPFLDWLEEAEGEQLEQRGRYYPVAQVLFSWLSLRCELRFTRCEHKTEAAALETMVTGHQMPHLCRVWGMWDVAWSSPIATVRSLGNPDLFLSRTSQEGRVPSPALAHTAVGPFSRQM